jgi:hypothetical protein
MLETGRRTSLYPRMQKITGSVKHHSSILSRKSPDLCMVRSGLQELVKLVERVTFLASPTTVALFSYIRPGSLTIKARARSPGLILSVTLGLGARTP